MTSSLNLNTNKIVNLGTPTADQDAVTKAYVDTAGGLALLKASNLSDVANVTTSRTNLSAAKSGANSDITSITGLTTALTAAQGGTGLSSAGTAGNVLVSNGTTWTSAVGYSGMRGQVFTSSGTFTVPVGLTSVDVLVIAGGGSGGAAGGGIQHEKGGGGGAGGFIYRPAFPISPGTPISVTIGDGGSPQSHSPWGLGSPGSNSSFSNLQCLYVSSIVENNSKPTIFCASSTVLIFLNFALEFLIFSNVGFMVSNDYDVKIIEINEIT
jgi:hypothetical protein